MTIEDDIAFLERVPSFAMLGRDALRILAIGAESRYVHGGEVLFAMGDPADAGYLIQEGSFVLRTDNTVSSNTPEIKVARGALLGELALLTETTRPVTAIAAEPSTVIRVTRSLFLKMLEGFPDAARRLRDHIATRTNQATRDMVDVRGALDPRGGPQR
ncbi:MAG TPA: Crp/Fnr family transcriptional regulator [Xanthobacteraceae bacterium]|jgi:CRP-like cAMP-binding protein